MKNGLIEPSRSQWSSPAFLVPKKGGKLRFVIDYRRLNQICIKDRTPLARQEDLLSSFQGMQWFSTVDMAWGFWGVPMEEDSKQYTAFVTPDGLYQWKVMPMGFTNSPAIFTRLMHMVLAGINWRFCLVYLDDVIMFSSSFAEHLEHIEEVLSRIVQANLSLKGEKCQFVRTEVEYLGHLVSKEGIATDPRKVKTIVDMPVPMTKKDLRTFLGMSGYYSEYVYDYARIAHSLFSLMKKDSPDNLAPVWNPAVHGEAICQI